MIDWDKVEINKSERVVSAPGMIPWTDEFKRQAFDLYELGKSISQVAKEMQVVIGVPVSRSAVTGMLRRYRVSQGLTGRPPGVKIVKRKSKGPKPIPPKPGGYRRDPRTVPKTPRTPSGPQSAMPVPRKRTYEQNVAVAKTIRERYDELSVVGSEGVDLLGLTSRTCLWPMSKVDDYPPYTYCGEIPHRPGAPYCEYHRSLSLDPHRKRKRDAPRPFIHYARGKERR